MAENFIERERYSYEQRWRLKNNHNAMRKSQDRLLKAVGDENNSSEVYAAVGELLLWIITTNEWFVKNNKKEYLQESQNNEQILGMRYAFNKFKHNMDFFTLITFSQVIKVTDNPSMEITKEEIKWFPINLLDERKALEKEGMGERRKKNMEKQIKDYQYLQGKEVVPSFEKVISFLTVEINKILFN